MRHRTITACALAGLALAGAACSATSRAATTSARTLPLSFTMVSVTTRGKELPIKVYASGAITAAGVWREKTAHGLDRVTVVFPAGKLYLSAREDLSWQPDFGACLARARGGTTWTVTGGTGAYRGTTGGGTYTDHGTLLGARTADGTCRGKDAPPPYVVVTADFVGKLSLPTA